MRWHQSSTEPMTSFEFVPISSCGALWLYYRPPNDQMLLGTNVDDFLLSSTSTSLANSFALHFGGRFTCKMTIAREYIGLHIIRDLQARRIYMSQAMLIDRLLDKESDS